VVNLITGFQGHRRRVLERVPTVSPTTVAACSGVPFRLQLDLDDLLRVVPRAAGVGHEDSLIQAEQGNGDQVADKEVLVEEANASVEKKTVRKMLNIPL